MPSFGLVIRENKAFRNMPDVYNIFFGLICRYSRYLLLNHLAKSLIAPLANHKSVQPYNTLTFRNKLKCVNQGEFLLELKREI